MARDYVGRITYTKGGLFTAEKVLSGKFHGWVSVGQGIGVSEPAAIVQTEEGEFTYVNLKDIKTIIYE